MQSLKFTYNGHEVEFSPNETHNFMVNATSMAKIFKKDVHDFIRNKTTQAYIDECLSIENMPYLGIEHEGHLLITKQKSGSWMHPVLALKFAAWLNPAFEFWVFKNLNQLMYAEGQNAQPHRRLSNEERIVRLKHKLIKDPKVAEYYRLLEKKKANQDAFLTSKGFKPVDVIII